MNHATRALLIGLLVLGLGAAWWILSDRAGAPGPDRPVAGSAETDISEDRPAESGVDPASVPDEEAPSLQDVITVHSAPPAAPEPASMAQPDSAAPRAFREARTAASAGALQDVADRYRGAGETQLADELETFAYQLCGGIDVFVAPYSVTEWALVELQAWCEDYPASITADDLRNRSLSGANVIAVLDRYPAIAALNPSERAVELARMAVSAETPGELHAVRQIVTNLATAGPSRSVFLDTAGLPDLVDFQAGQRAALELLECRTFGGCGPGDPLTLEHCVITGVCERGWSREEAQRNLLTPVEWEIAQSILALFDSVAMGDG